MKLALLGTAVLLLLQSYVNQGDASQQFGTPLLRGSKCVVIAYGPNARREYGLTIGRCSEAVNFRYDRM
jgi:hypothetical protein